MPRTRLRAGRRARFARLRAFEKVSHFMVKILNRCVALLLVPCLVSDPATAVGFDGSFHSSLSLASSQIHEAVFQTEALAAVEAWADHPLARVKAFYTARTIGGRLAAFRPRALLGKIAPHWRIVTGAATAMVVIALATTGRLSILQAITWGIGVAAVFISNLSPPPSTPWLAPAHPELLGKRILEVTAELALSPPLFDLLDRHLQKKGMGRPDIRAERRKAAMASSVGGIGPLLRERVIAQAELGANVVGVSLLYSHVYVQKRKTIHLPNGQVRHVLVQEKLEIGSLLREVLEPAGEIHLQMYDGTETYVKVWKAPDGTFGKGTMYFLDPAGLADVIEGRANVVYPGEQDAAQSKEEALLTQKWVLGRGALALMKRLGQKPDIIVMSEPAAMMAHPRLFRDGLTEDPFFRDSITVYNDHTPLEYAHPHWDNETVQKIHLEPRVAGIKQFWGWDDQKKKEVIDMTSVIINSSDGVYGVSKKHAEVMRRLPGLEPFAGKIRYVTNGVSPHYWPAENPDALLKHPDEDILRFRNDHRHQGLRWLVKREHEEKGRLDRSSEERPRQDGLNADWVERVEDKPIILWDRRLVKYKRLERLTQMLEDEKLRNAFIETNAVIIFGGRAHPDDPYGPDEYSKIQALREADPRLRDRVVFFENYNVDEAPELFRLADASIMLSDKGQAAAETGFQKMQLNGGWVIATDDGAIPESVNFYGKSDKRNGFEVPYVQAFDENGKTFRTPTAVGLLQAIQQLSDVFYNPKERAQMIRNALEAAPKVSIQRTAQDMLNLFSEYWQEAARNREADLEGKRLAKEWIDETAVTPAQAYRLQDHMNRPGQVGFEWKYRKGMSGEEVSLHAGVAGLHGFVNDLETIQALGTVGEWSLGFHARSGAGGGDLVRHTYEFLNETAEDLPTFRSTLERIAQQIRQSESPQARIYQEKVLMSFLKNLERSLGDRAAARVWMTSEEPRDQKRVRIETQFQQGAGLARSLHATPHQVYIGEGFEIEAEVDLGSLTPQDVLANVLIGRQAQASEWIPMDWSYLGQGRYRVSARHTLQEMGTYRFTIRISPREADLWPSGQAFDQATRSTQAWERIYVGERDGIAKETSPKTGAILQIHALASGSRRDKTGRVIPGTAAHFFGQLPRIIRQPWSAVHLTGILETGPLVNDIAKNNRRFTPGTPYFAWDVDPHRHSRRWFLYQPAQDGHADLIGSPFAVSNPKGVNPAWGTLEQLQQAADLLRAHGKTLYVDYTPNQTGMDDPWLLEEDNWKATVHIDLAEIIPASRSEAFKNLKDEDFYSVQTLQDKLGQDVVDRLHEEFAKRNLGLGDGLQYAIFYKTPGDPGSRIIIAHAKDPRTPPPWIDTVALDLAQPKARARLFEIANFWARRGIHLRIDMSDLAIRNTFMVQWHPRESTRDVEVTNRLWGYPGDFWDEFWEKVMVPHPNFTVILEAYRDLPYLNEFARSRNVTGQPPRISVYEKSPYDNLAGLGPKQIHDALAGLPESHSVTFTQNQDDSAPWSKGVSYIKLMVALLAIAGGEFMVHYRQLRGEPRMPVQRLLPDSAPRLSRQEAELLEEFHMDMVDLHRRPIVQRANKYMLYTQNENFVAMTRELNDQRLLVVANPTGAAQNGFIPLPPHWLPQKGDHLIFEEKYYREDQPTTALGQDRAAPVYVRSLQDLTNGLYVELQPGQVHIFVVYPKPRVAIPTGGADINQSGPSAGKSLPVGLAGRMAAFAVLALLLDPFGRILTDLGRGAWVPRWGSPRGLVHERPLLWAAA